MSTEIAQTVFAKWHDGYYYPAVINRKIDDDLFVAYLDGSKGVVTHDKTMSIDQGLKTLKMQGRWDHGSIFYKGRIITEPMDNAHNHHGSTPTFLTMYYNDGDVEVVDLSQLRGEKEGEPVVWKRLADTLLGLIVFGGLALIGGVIKGLKGENRRFLEGKDKNEDDEI